MHTQRRRSTRRAREHDLRIQGRCWIEGKEGTFLGQGRITLLERIREHGSISQAARSMEMSYRHAWGLVESMNRQASGPLVEKATGGRGGGGARLTETGEQAIALFRKYDERIRRYLETQSAKMGL